MNCPREFKLTEQGLTSLPTGAVKVVVEALGRQIASGRFKPGETLPREELLGREHAVSRTVLRESIKVLSGKGMVRTARRHGTRVCAFEDWHLLDPDVIRWHAPGTPMAARIRTEAGVMRWIIEPEAARLAALNATDLQVETILEAARALTPEPYGMAGIIAADYAFHSTILQSTGNMMLARMNGLILAMLPFYHASGTTPSADLERLREEHLAVAEAIAARDPGAARSHMRALLTAYVPADFAADEV